MDMGRDVYLEQNLVCTVLTSHPHLHRSSSPVRAHKTRRQTATLFTNKPSRPSQQPVGWMVGSKKRWSAAVALVAGGGGWASFRSMVGIR